MIAGRQLSPIQRLLFWLPIKLAVTLFAISFVTFLFTNLIPGDTSRAILGRGATEAQIEEFRRQQGLDRPLLVRYGVWIRNMLSGNWGRSISSGRTVRELVLPRLERTVILACGGFALALVIGIALGAFAGQRSGGTFDTVLSYVTLGFTAVPEFVVAIGFIAVFAVQLGLLPVSAADVSLVTASFEQQVHAYLGPTLVVAAVNAPYIIRLTRANTREVISEPYVRAASLRGVPRHRVLIEHVLPNALPPVIGAFAIVFAALFGGVVAIEAVFGFPGIGSLLVGSVVLKDVQVVQVIALIVGTAFVLVNTLGDVVQVLLTPRLRTR